MKKFFLFICLSVVCGLAIAQLPIAYYDFENNSNRTQFENVSPLAVNAGGSAIAVTNGNLADNNGAGLFNGGLQTGKAIGFYRGQTSSSTDPKTGATSYMQFTVNSTGFAVISLEFDVMANSTAAAYYGVSVSTNGTSWSWVGSVTTPGTGNSFPWSNLAGIGYWASGKCNLPAMANNASSLYVRFYAYKSTSNGNNGLLLDNMQVSASGTVPGATTTLLDQRDIYTGRTSGLTGMLQSLSATQNTNFTVSGQGTNLTLPYLYVGGVAGAGGNLTISNNATLTISAGANTFYVDSASGNIPVSTINILSGGKLILNNELECQGNLNLDNGTLQLNGQKLVLGGSISNNNGSIHAGSGTLELVNKRAAQALSGTLFTGKKIDKLINSNPYGINISSVANDTLMITGSISFGDVNNSVVNTGNNLTLVSSASATAAVADVTNGGVNSGNRISGKVTVERFISNAGKWRLLAVPTNSTQTFKQAWQEGAATSGANPVAGYGVLIGDNRSNWSASGFDLYTPGGATVKTYNATSGSWVGISSTQTPIKNIGGYMTFIRGSRSGSLGATTMRSSGELYNGAQPVIDVPANQFMVVGNPYAAPIDLNNVKKEGLQDVFYVWDPKAGGGYGLGAYQTLLKKGNGYVVFPGGGSYGAQLSAANSIESGQAFFVKATAAGGTIQFEEKNKQTGSRMVFRAPAENSAMLRATLYSVTADTTTLLDAAMVDFDSAYANSVDADDIAKFTNGSENVSIKNGVSLLMADRRNGATAQDTIRLNLTGVRVQSYKWSISMEYMNANGPVAFLKDAYSNTLTPLNMDGTTEYTFNMVNIPGAYAANRFSIVFSEALVLPVSITGIAASRSASKSSDVLVEWKVENEIGIQQYEVEFSSNGSTFSAFSKMDALAGNNGSKAYSQTHTQALEADNFYRIKAISNSGLVQYSAIVKVAAAKKGTVSAISVYPNPVVNKNMNVQFLNKPAGAYAVQLLNQSGAVIFQNKVQINNSNAASKLQLPGNTAAGTYQLVVTDGNAARTVVQVVVL